MNTEPTIVQRAAQPYAAIKEFVTMQTIGEVLPAVHPEVFGWLGAHGIAPAGAPFWKYNVIEMAGQMEVEVGVPIAAAVDGDERILADVLPAGRYATLQHTGHPSELMAATATLLDWAKGQDLKWDMSGAEERWAARLEIYETDPREQPDMNKWETVLAFKLAD
jgi:effector-binding domain-containing protein